MGHTVLYWRFSTALNIVLDVLNVLVRISILYYTGLNVLLQLSILYYTGYLGTDDNTVLNVLFGLVRVSVRTVLAV